MSGSYSRTKGHDWERAVSAYIRARFPHRTVHRSSQGDRAYQPDVVVGPTNCGGWDGSREEHDPGSFWYECISSARPNVFDKLAQAVRDVAANKSDLMPVVVAKKTHYKHGPTVTLRLDDFARLMGWPEPKEKEPSI